MISKYSLDFLSNLQANNNRPWFEEHKNDYLRTKKELEVLIKKVETNLNKVDNIEFSKLYRIYRDVRFSKNKLPYKDYLGGYYRRFGHDRRGTYTFDISPNGASVVGGGFFGPNTDDLLRIRKEFEMDGSYIDKITTEKAFVDSFGSLKGISLKTAPRGFDKNHPNIKWLRMKQFLAFRNFTDDEVTHKDFADQMTETFITLRPFLDYMTDILTTDMNGVSIL
ncbi:MAG: TIGR02453 family protein [uncultured Aureispira sp.]|uniref:TIGR02453 family protein n=1 Tax=uncultured Aureispira sp. TaxID=1331704 RepID=A0A6S6TPA5_9BACT|nr:MAG: TIGR02453 family protein [uncultured Aureispira sp.]